MHQKLHKSRRRIRCIVVMVKSRRLWRGSFNLADYRTKAGPVKVAIFAL